MIIPLEEQVCYLESAKRLKELGFPQESLFYWATDGGHDYEVRKLETPPFPCDISAYTVTEIGGLLYYKDLIGIETLIYKEGIFCFPQVKMYRKEHSIHRNTFMGYYLENSNLFPTESEARAKMLIYLKENGLM